MTAPDAVVAPIWLALNLALGACLWRAAREMFPRDTLRQGIFHTLTMAWAVITLVSIALGSIGLLARYGPMAGVGGLILALAVVCKVRRSTGSSGDQGSVSFATTFLTSLTQPSNLIISLLVLFLVGHTFFDGFRNFVSDWDSLMYHIPLVDQWIHAQSLYAPDCFQWSNPGGNELIGFWIMAPFSGDFFAPLNNLLSTALLLISVLELAPWLGLSSGYAKLAAGAAVANYVVLDQLINAGNDVAVTALFLTTLAYGIRFAESVRKPDMILCGLSLGLLAGIKYFALGYAAVACAICGWLAVRRRGLLVGAQFTAVSILLAVAIGGYWYARNFIISGSPFYPLGITTGDDRLSERYPHPWSSSFFGCRQPEVFTLGLQALWRMTGPYHVGAILSLPLIIGWCLVTGLRAGQQASRDVRLALAALLVGSVAVYLATPFCVEDNPGTLNQLHRGHTPARYGLSPLTLAVLGLSVCLQDITRGLQPSGKERTASWQRAASNALFLFAGLAIFAQFIFTEVNLQIDRLACTLFVLNGVAIVLLLQRVSRRVLASAILLAIFGTGPLTWWIATSWRSGFYKAYDRFSNTEIYSRVRDIRPTTKICLFDYLCHPFFGPERQGSVCQPQDVPSPEWLLDYLKSQNSSLVVINSRADGDPALNDSFAKIVAWLNTSAQHAQLVYHERDRLLYRISHASLASAPYRRASPDGLAPSSTEQPRESNPFQASVAKSDGGRNIVTQARNP